ncbi:HEAT repeat domain-containing protein [Hahella sp. CR1]|uniref:HEAT repeat domain-containing protein n=1 Tax=Hahella sp. CR1 TaxID=2992807 RepID=UPI0032611803
MCEVRALIRDLASSDASIRDRSALTLMDIGDERAVEPLFRAITKPENINHRGTLVYALSAFNCEAFVEVLVDIVLTGSFEVSITAFSIIADSITSPESLMQMQAQLLKFDKNMLSADHHHEAYQELLELAASVSDGYEQ